MINKCDRCGTLSESYQVKINAGHFEFMTTFAKCIGGVSSTDEVEKEFLVKRVFNFCKKCVSLLGGSG